VTAAAFFQDVRWYTRPIVPDAQAESPFFVGNLRFNMMSLSVAEGIAQRLAGDPVDLVSDDRVTRRTAGAGSFPGDR